MFKKIILCALLLALGLGTNAQVSPLEIRISLSPGDYPPEKILDAIRAKEIRINYSSSALRKGSIKIETEKISVREALEKILDLENYEYVVKDEKILVIPKSNRKIKTYSGFVEEFGSKERLVGVNVTVPSLNLGTTTNSYGYYSLSVPVEDTLEAVISFIGYESQRFRMYHGNHDVNDFQLKPVNTELAEVTVTEKQLSSETSGGSEISLSPMAIEKVPSLLGEIDVLKVLQLLPGVQSGVEGSSGMYVRGGSPDQNLLLLDGVPVYNASHLFGFFSVFNSDAIKNVTLTKGGFPARYGGRLSSVVSIDMKEGNMNEFHGRGSIGLLSSRLTIEGPIVKNKTSFALSGRRTYLDQLMRPFWRDGNRYGYFFHDINLKLNHVISREDRVYLSYYGGRDKFFYDFDSDEYESRNSLGWGNQTASARWNHIYNNRLFGNLTAIYTQYEFRTAIHVKSPFQESGFDYFSRIRDYGLRYDYEYQPILNHKLRFGLSYTLHDFKPQVAQAVGVGQDIPDLSLDISESSLSNDLFAYAEDEWSINPKWKANYGFHYATYFLPDAFYHSLQPRVSLRYMLAPQWSLKASYAEMMQSVHLLANNSIGLPTDVWVTSNAQVRPQYSRQLALGSTKNFGEQWEISTELYYKWMHNLIAYKEGQSLMNSTSWENAVETDGTGNSYGGEIFIRRSTGKLTGWLGYTLAWSNRRFENINNGKEFPFRYDRRHDVSLVFNYEFSEKFDLSLNWVYGTGVAFTMPLAEYYMMGDDGQVVPVTQYSDRNAHRMPAYHRMDIGFNWHRVISWGKSTFSAGLYNAYSRRNPFAIDIRRNWETGERKLMQVSVFPILPSVSYTFNF